MRNYKQSKSRYLLLIILLVGIAALAFSGYREKTRTNEVQLKAAKPPPAIELVSDMFFPRGMKPFFADVWYEPKAGQRFLQPGDFIDVISERKSKSQEVLRTTLLNSVKVLAMSRPSNGLSEIRVILACKPEDGENLYKIIKLTKNKLSVDNVRKELMTHPPGPGWEEQLELMRAASES